MGDVFEGVSSEPAAFARVRGYVPAPNPGISFEIGDPWRFYSLFWKAHNLDRQDGLIPVPEMAAELGEKISVPFLACNRTKDAVEITINASLPAPWKDSTEFTRYPLRPGECYPQFNSGAGRCSGIGQTKLATACLDCEWDHNPSTKWNRGFFSGSGGGPRRSSNSKSSGGSLSAPKTIRPSNSSISGCAQILADMRKPLL